MTLKKVVRATAVTAALVMLAGCGGSNSASTAAGAGSELPPMLQARITISPR